MAQTDKQTHRQTDMATLRPTRPRGPSWWKPGVRIAFIALVRKRPFPHRCDNGHSQILGVVIKTRPGVCTVRLYSSPPAGPSHSDHSEQCRMVHYSQWPCGIHLVSSVWLKYCSQWKPCDIVVFQKSKMVEDDLQRVKCVGVYSPQSSFANYVKSKVRMTTHRTHRIAT